MVKIYKKIIKVILTIFIFLCFSFNVFGKTMQVLEPSTKSIYKIKFNWEKPNINLPNNEYLDSYRIYYKNNTLGEDYSSTTKISYKENMDNTNLTLTKDIYLKEGSLYNFKIVPVYIKQEPNNVTIEREGNVISEFLFMTDIQVKAESKDNEDTIVVNWKVPTMNNQKHFFSSYKVSFAEILYGQKLQWKDEKEVDVEKLVIDKEGYASYKIINDSFKLGALYAVKIEPVYNSKLRDDIIHKEVISENKKYIFSTTPISKRLFTYDKTYIKIPLYLTLSSLTDINLNWPSLVKSSIGEHISKLEMFKFETINGVEIKSTLGCLYDQNARVTTNFNTQVPNTKPVKYMFTVTYKDIIYLNEDGSIIGPFNILVDSQKAIYDPDLNDFSPYRPTIFKILDNRKEPFILDLTWEAFLRDSYNEKEIIDPIYGKYLDKDITYKIWVTDDKNNFEYLDDKTSTILDGKNLTDKNINDKPYYNTKLNKYYYLDEKGNISSNIFIENKIYYIKILAIRNKDGKESRIDYGSHYIVPIANIPVNPNVMAKPPLRIKKINGIDDITKTSITIEWDEEWFEFYDEKTKKWYSKVGIENKKLVFGEDIKDDSNILYNLRAVDENGKLNYSFTRKKIVNELSKYISIPVIRMISLENAKYKLHVADFNQLEKIGYNKYIEILNEKDSSYKWLDILPKGLGKLEYKCETVQNIEGAMKPSSPYVIFIKPFEGKDDTIKLACYPTYICATTLSDINQGNIKPITPILYPVDTTDTTITVKWEYIEELKYKVKFSETMNDYPKNGIILDNDYIKKNSKIKEENNKKYIYLTIDKLFPESIYFVWAKSLVNGEKIERESEYSNAVEMHTKILNSPYAPKGLGLASKQNVKLYNIGNNKNYNPSSKEYIIIEWLKYVDDKIFITEGSGLDTDLAQPLYHTNLNKNTYMLKFNKLIANKRYYFRVKTRLYVSKDKDGSLLKKYSYIAQVSLDENFKDSVELEIPKYKDNNGKDKKILYKDSSWSSISLITDYSDSEYDGDKDPNLYPLPDKDYEIIYDYQTSTLKYRFRSNKIDNEGNKDNNVDERFISKLIIDKTFLYEIDISNYKSKNIKNRIIEIPFTIISAFNERKIDFRIISDNFILTIPPGSIEVDKLKNMNFSPKDIKIIIEISENFNLKNNNIYLSRPHKLSIKISSENNTINLDSFSKPLKVNMLVSKNIDNLKDNISSYINEDNSAIWRSMESEYDENNNSVKFLIQKPAVYSIIKNEIRGNNIKGKLNIKDLNNYNENETIHANQYNQIISSIIKGDKEVLMNKPLSNKDYNMLGKAKILVSGGKISRESALNSLVKVYELKNKKQIKSYENIENTIYKDIKNADKEYQINLLKAVEIGFLREPDVRPKDNLTIGDLMYILDIILNI